MRGGAIVTGGNTGIGRAIILALAQAGFDIGITWFEREGEVRTLLEKLAPSGSQARAEYLDLRDTDSIPRVIGGLADSLGGISVLVNNAGTGVKVSFLDHSLEDWDRVLAVDLTGAFLCGQVVGRRMVEQGHGGRIINITSVHEFKPTVQGVAYGVAKAGLSMLTKTMALELGIHGITVNAIAPGEITTAMNAQEGLDPMQLQREWLALGRPGTPREVAETALWLASDASSYVTGTTFVVDGGLLLGDRRPPPITDPSF